MKACLWDWRQREALGCEMFTSFQDVSFTFQRIDPSLPGRGLVSHPRRACRAQSLAGSARRRGGLGTDAEKASKCSSWGLPSSWSSVRPIFGAAAGVTDAME